MSKTEEIAALVQEHMSAAAGKTLAEVDVSGLPDRVAAWLRQNVPGFECAAVERARLDGDTLSVTIVLPEYARVERP